LIRLPSRFGNLIWFHHHKPAKRCSRFQAESFRLSIMTGMRTPSHQSSAFWPLQTIRFGRNFP
jgi:hypothetical protein